MQVLPREWREYWFSDKEYEAECRSDVVRDISSEPTFSIFVSFEVGATLGYQEIAKWMNKRKKKKNRKETTSIHETRVARRFTINENKSDEHPRVRRWIFHVILHINRHENFVYPLRVL